MARWTLPFLSLLLAGPISAAPPDGFDAAHKLLQTGKYAEALEAYDALAKDTPDDAAKVKAAIGKADSLASTGELEKAAEALKPFAEREKPDPDAAARLADLEFDRGHWDRDRALANSAIKIKDDHVAARWVLARLLESTGKLKEADTAFKWFIDYQNKDPKALSRNAPALVIVGQAAERDYRRNARGEDLKDTLEEVINDLYDAALRTDPTYWQAPWLEAKLFLSGYNEPAAMKELTLARKINPGRPRSSSLLARRICRATSSLRVARELSPPWKSTPTTRRPTSSWPT